MKCLVLLVNRGLAKFYLHCTFTGSKGYVKKFLFFNKFAFGIGANIKPFTLDVSRPFRRNRSLPLFVVNENTGKAIGSDLSEKPDEALVQLLNTLSEANFYKNMMKKLKLSLGETLIYIFAGVGLGLMIDQIIRVFVHG